mmetsp:Transcript_1653/g.4395  ORF Transcript_1653/g.4395 Transcript_1653/m.4395 type:complete len:204 (+) Transcript_1653:202-813(+)
MRAPNPVAVHGHLIRASQLNPAAAAAATACLHTSAMQHQAAQLRRPPLWQQPSLRALRPAAAGCAALRPAQKLTPCWLLAARAQRQKPTGPLGGQRTTSGGVRTGACSSSPRTAACGTSRLTCGWQVLCSCGACCPMRAALHLPLLHLLPLTARRASRRRTRRAVAACSTLCRMTCSRLTSARTTWCSSCSQTATGRGSRRGC